MRRTTRQRAWAALFLVGLVALLRADAAHCRFPWAGRTARAHAMSPSGYEEVVEVVGRLGADGPRPAAAEPRSVLVIDRAFIDASGARSVPELLARLPGVAAMDQVGNGRQLAMGLRGFDGAGAAVAVMLDGTRLNDPETGVPALELVRLDDLERIEISHGPHGAVLGSGALGGSIHLLTRAAPSTWRAETRARLGSFGLRELGAGAGGPMGRVAFRVGAGWTRERGFRRASSGGDAVDEESARVALSHAGRRVATSLSWSHLDGRWRQPGRLPIATLAADPRGVPWNALDFAAARHDLLTLRAERRRGGATEWVAVGSWRQRAGEVLTTGTTGYGFLTRDRVQSFLASVEGSTPLRSDRRLRVRWGADAARDRISGAGFTTDDVRDGSVDALEQASISDVAWDRAAAFAALVAEWPGGVTLEASVRQDSSEVRRGGKELSAGGSLLPVSGSRRFTDTSLGLGVSGRVDVARGPDVSWRAAAGQSFQPPTALELFAYPGFSSNPDLDPQRGTGLSGGVGLRGRRWQADVGLHATAVRDEIVYDAHPSARRNLNASRTLRRGVDLGLVLTPRPKVRLDLRHAAASATFRTAWADSGGPVLPGDRVPLVADRSSASLALGPWRRTSVDAAIRRVGSAHAANDFDNSSQVLPSQLLLSLSLARDVRLPAGEGRLGLHLDNVLDRVQPTWGVEVGREIHVTPAPPRSFTVSFDFHF